MGALLSYSIVGGTVLMCLYLVFAFTLSDKKQHGYNRGVAMGIYAVSFLALPLRDMMTGGAAAVSGDLGMVTADMVVNAVAAEHRQAVWPTVVVWIYTAGMMAVAMVTVVTWLRIISLVVRGQRIRCEGYTLVLTDGEGVAPFSWMRYVVMNRSDYAECAETILAHECRHIALGHWVDLMVAQAAVIVGWYNPAVWLMRRELMLVHEYQADNAVIESGCNALQYQTILIRKAVGARFPSLANSLNHSNLKKRITMMYEKKSSKGHRLGAVALVPAAALALSLTGLPSVNAAIHEIEGSELLLGKGTENPDIKQVVTSASYQINIDFRDRQTKMTLSSEQFATARIENLLLVADGVPYKPDHVNTNVDDGVGTIDLTFAQIETFKNGTLTFDCGDKPVAVTIGCDGSGHAMSSDVRMGNESKIPDNAIVHKRESVVKVGPGAAGITISTVENDNAPIEQRLTLDRSMMSDGVAYIYNGRQITKAQFESLDQSNITMIRTDKTAGRDVLVMVIMDKNTVPGHQ